MSCLFAEVPCRCAVGRRLGVIGVIVSKPVFSRMSTRDILGLIASVTPGEPIFARDPSSNGVPQVANITAANDLVGFGSTFIIGHGSSSIRPAASAALRDASWA
jgi:hypothetical protein